MTSGFRSPLRFEDEYGLPYTLLEPLIYDSAFLGVTLIVPAGFKTDLASIPRPLWNILPPFGRYDRAAVIHDAAYQMGYKLTRAQADRVLCEAMQVLGVNRVQRWAIYSGVRVGGWAVWRRYRKADALKVVAADKG